MHPLLLVGAAVGPVVDAGNVVVERPSCIAEGKLTSLSLEPRLLGKIGCVGYQLVVPQV